jgi:hypothetical protein
MHSQLTTRRSDFGTSPRSPVEVAKGLLAHLDTLTAKVVGRIEDVDAG